MVVVTAHQPVKESPSPFSTKEVNLVISTKEVNLVISTSEVRRNLIAP